MVVVSDCCLGKEVGVVMVFGVGRRYRVIFLEDDDASCLQTDLMHIQIAARDRNQSLSNGIYTLVRGLKR